MKNTKKEFSLMDHKALMMKELAEGIKLAKQLRIRMRNSSTNGDSDTCLIRESEQALNYSLLDKMLSSFDNSLSLAKLFEFDDSPECSLGVISSPSSEVSSQDLRVSKKRKKMPHRIEMVQVTNPNKPVSGLEGPLNDGLSWRKYGQKDILGANFPRSYYRCTHRYTQSCVARKQVQKLDKDPSIYQVIYKGEHTCVSGAQFYQAHKEPKQAQLDTELQPLPQSLQQEICLRLDQKVDAGPTEKEIEAQIFQPISYISSQFEPELTDEYIFSSSPNVGDFDMLPEIDSNFSFYFDPLSCRSYSYDHILG